MPRLTHFTTSLILALLLISLFALAVPRPAQAQSLWDMSCNELWYVRNQIFADKGYCFKSERAQAVFGAACFPPYGRLSAFEQNKVDAIKKQERTIGCAASTAPPTAPQGSIYANMSCPALWYQRNAIYAENGHCFKSDRGRDVFGNGCFPPYGELGSTDKRRVNEILQWEGRRGC